LRRELVDFPVPDMAGLQLQNDTITCHNADVMTLFLAFVEIKPILT
jgi:hypothetical protein